MANIIPKLNLNKTPNLVENNSLVFAKNIRLDVDGTIHRDYGVFPLSITKDKKSTNYINYKNILNRIISDVKDELDTNPEHEEATDWWTKMYIKLMYISGQTLDNGYKNGKHQIVGIIPDSNNFYIFIHGTYQISDDEKDLKSADFIIRYDEKEDRFYPCNCNWHWSGGTINGCVINNLIGETLLNIGETGATTLVPFKSINLNQSKFDEDESIYTQVPKIPITNLSYAGNFSCVIPNGVYQFFVRYKIRKDFYTNWFPASSELFVGNKNNVITSFGSLKYVNTHRDSDNSFILSVEHLIDDNKESYKGFQIGFILSHDDALYARAWKHFNFDINNINFDYKAEDAIEIEPTDLLKSTYGLYNVGNITSFKNKLYISNYTESEFNDQSLQSCADDISIELKKKEGGNVYDGNPVIEATVGNKTVVAGITVDGVDKTFSGSNGIFHEICTTKTLSDGDTIEEAIEKCLNNEATVNASAPDLYSIQVIGRITNLTTAKNSLRNTYKNYNYSSVKITYSISFDNDAITDVTINGKSSSSSSYKSSILSAIYNVNRYLNENCKFIDAFGTINDTIKISIKRKAKVTRTAYYYNGNGFNPSGDDMPEVNPEIDDGLNRPGTTPGTGSGSSTTVNTFDATYSQDIEIQFFAWQTKYESDNATTLVNNTTLIPYQKYKFYMHFVKSTGEITNGFYCSKAGELEAPYMEKCTSVIYPVFKNIKIPNGYAACFFSISHTQITAATIFNIKDDPNNNIKEGSCFDINMMLVPGSKGIHIKQGNVNSSGGSIVDPVDPPTILDPDLGIETTTATINETVVETYSGQYYMSSDSSLPRYFGADGVVTFDKTNIDNNKLAYAITDYSISDAEDIQLIKCTPYISAKNLSGTILSQYFDDYTKMNLLGFICSVTPLLRDVCIKYYSDGSSVYFKRNDKDNIGEYNSTGTLYLDELNKYDDGDSEKKLANFSLKTSNDVFIYSNYNLNYVTLSEEPKMAIKTYYNRPANSTGQATESEANSENSIFLRLLSSQLMSDAYTLPSMYKSYLRKTYSLYNDNETTVFNNTVRSSILYGDENRVNLLAFDANDYYNIPTNRGIIINLVAVGDTILVHTQDSMFKFSGSNTLQSSDGEIQPAESQPFDTGVSEVFGSDFGFAGLQVKSDSIITENGYIFFDRDSRIIYMYAGQGQIVKINDSIEKLFRHRDIKNIYFANDFYNNRFFISIMFYETYVDKDEIKERFYPVTLSFNVHEQIKSFVSLHDFYYHKAFNTKTKCYFLTSDIQDICTINKDYKSCYTKLEIVTDKIYPYKKEIIYINAIDSKTNVLTSYNIFSYDSIVDVISNSNFETVKTLNAVNWCSNIIKSEYEDIDTTDDSTLRMAEDINNTTACKYLRVYTDTCMTPLNDFRKVSNNYSISSVDSYKYPRYNQGFWTFNYFRNILNSNGNKTKYVSDQNSLIEGKYFVVRFVFDSEFKLETLTLNYQNK